MPGIDIKRLRQEGKLDEALLMAKEEFEAVPTDDWAKRNLAWVYDSFCKKYAEEGNYHAFTDSVCALISLGVNESDPILINSIGWRFRSLLSSIENNTNEKERIHVLDRMFELVRQFNFEKPSETYSVLFKAFLKYKDIWPAFKDYCEWWNFDSFRPEDYVCEVFASGKKESFCLVERAYIAYAKCLLQEQTKDIERIKSFAEKLENLAEAHPEMDYPGYFAGKLMMALNEKAEEIITVILPFIRKKRNEFWAWQLLAEATEKDNKDLYLACLLRAIHCKTKREFLVKIRLRLVEELVKRQDYYHASQQLRLYCETKLAMNSNWKPSGEIRHFLEESWYRQDRFAQPEPFPIDYMAITNNVLFVDIPEQVCVVSFVNENKQIVNVVYGKEKEGFFKFDSSLRPQIGMLLYVRFQEISKDGFMKVFSARVCSEDTQMALDYYKKEKGTVIYNQQKNVYSFKSDDVVCFIPPQYVDKYSIEKGQTLIATILHAYNKKKEKWMWRIIGLELTM